MKTAVLLSGHMRTFDRCLPTLHWHVFRHFGTVDFFVSTIDDADAPKAEILREKYPGRFVAIERVKEQPDCIAELRGLGCVLPGTWEKGKPYTHEPYPISVHPQAVARQLWQLNQAWHVFVRAALPASYDVVIRCRPDLWFHASEHPCPSQPFPVPDTVACTPWWGRFGGINDRFAIMGMSAAAAYFDTYPSIPSLLAAGCPFHPECLIRASLEMEDIEIHDDLRAEFSTLRANGELRPPEISAQDIAHLAAS